MRKVSKVCSEVFYSLKTSIIIGCRLFIERKSVNKWEITIHSNFEAAGWEVLNSRVWLSIEAVTCPSWSSRNKGEDYFLCHQSLAFSHSETILPGPGPVDSSEGTKPDTQKNELNPSHVGTKWCPMSSTCAAHSEEIKQIQSTHLCSVHFYFCLYFRQSFP